MDPFYKAFEDKFRGSRDLILSRQEVYLPFLMPIAEKHRDASAVDLGCGRGEWLELLKNNNIHGRGVDTDEAMVQCCREMGFEVSHQDGVEYLRSLEDNSQICVSAFHVVEHIPFEMLQSLVQEAKRVLKPGGLLILETPNPENITVGTSQFYLDPTHIKPIPPQLLAFLPEYYGYTKVKTMRLQESLSLNEYTQINLFDVLSGVSPDYAVVAQKDADPNLLGLNDAAFKKEYGVSLEKISKRYARQQEGAVPLFRRVVSKLARSFCKKIK